MATVSKKTDMTTCPLFKNIILYTLPVMATGILQFLYNAADTVVVGRFAADSETSLAAVGSTGSLSNLITGLFMGLSVGAGVSISHALGAGKRDTCKNIVHTAISSAAIIGVLLALVGYFTARPLLALTGVPDEVLGSASLYMRTVFLGMPALVLYNFAAAIFNARGDTKHPFFFLLASGTLNVILNLVFVVGLKLDVLGVAIATVASQYLSAFLILRLLSGLDDDCRLDIKHLYIRKAELLKMIRIGLPAGLQGCVFALSNVIIQSSINSFGKPCMAANTAASNLDGLIYIALNSFYHSSLAFTGQNYGARRFDRIARVRRICLSSVAVFGVALGGGVYVFGRQLLALYGVTEPDVQSIAMTRLLFLGVPYFTCGMMEVLSGMLRGVGRSATSMIISLLGACVFRIVWIYTVFQVDRSIESLYISYPISWVLTTAVSYIVLRTVLRRERRVSE